MISSGNCKNVKSGFTLTELLIALSCASLLIVCVCSAFVYLSGAGNNILKQSSSVSKLPLIRDYITNNAADSNATELSERFDFSDGNVTDRRNGVVVAQNMLINSAKFEDNGDFIICILSDGKRDYTFTIDKQQSLKEAESQ